MITFLLLAGLLFVLAAALYWWGSEHKIYSHAGDAFAAAVVEPRNQRLYKKAMRQEENLQSLFQAKYKRLRTGLDLQHLLDDLKRKELQQAIEVLHLDSRYHLELRRQLQLMAPADNGDPNEVKRQDEHEKQKTQVEQQAEFERETSRRKFESITGDVERINEWHKGLVEAHGQEQADRMYKEFLRRVDNNQFD